MLRISEEASRHLAVLQSRGSVVSIPPAGGIDFFDSLAASPHALSQAPVHLSLRRRRIHSHRPFGPSNRVATGHVDAATAALLSRAQLCTLFFQGIVVALDLRKRILDINELAGKFAG